MIGAAKKMRHGEFCYVDQRLLEMVSEWGNIIVLAGQPCI